MASHEKDMLSEMLKTGIIGERWPNVTYLIVTIKEDENVFFEECYRSDPQDHAEMKMIKDERIWVEALVDVNGRYDIILIMNYSPCWKCAPKLIELKTKNKSSIHSFTICFAHPYQTKNPEDNKRNENCLKELSKAGITLEAMTERSWFDLVMRFRFNLKPDGVRKRDEVTRKKLKELLPEEAVGGPIDDSEVEEMRKQLEGLPLKDAAIGPVADHKIEEMGKRTSLERKPKPKMKATKGSASPSSSKK